MGTRIKHYLSKSIDKFIPMSQIKKVLSSFLSLNKFQSPLVPLIFHCSRIGEVGTVLYKQKNSPLIFLIFESSPAGGCVGPLKSVACFHNIGSRTHKITLSQTEQTELSAKNKPPVNVESTYLANGSIFSPLPPFPSHVAVLACIVFLISKAKLTNGSLFLLKVIKLREQDVNLDQNDVKRNFRY